MARKSKSKGTGSGRMLPVLHPDAAGIDIGAEEIFIAVPAERALEPVRSFGTFTRDLNELADWLKECAVRTIRYQSRWKEIIARSTCSLCGNLSSGIGSIRN